MLRPFSKNRQQIYAPQSKPTTIKPFKKVVQAPQFNSQQTYAPRTFASQNYLNSVATAEKLKKEADFANSGKGMALNFLKALPQATADATLGNVAKFVASAVEAPKVIGRGGETTQREYKIPGLSPFKSFQSDFEKTAGNVIEGKEGLGSAAWQLAQVPLAGLEMGTALRGFNKGYQSYKGAKGAWQGLKAATPEVVDAFLPTTRGLNKGKAPNRELAVATNEPESLSKTADKIINPLKPKSKERGFIETVRNSPELSQDLASRVDDTYNVRHNEDAMKKAQRLIFENPNEAERIATGGANDDAVFTANELIKNYDAIAIKAKKSGNMADFEVAMNKAVDIAEQSSRNLTEAGRTVQAASTINRLSPDGIIQYVNKAVRQVGGEGVRLSNEKYFNIVRKAEEIKGILDPKTKALKTFELIDDIYSDIPKSAQNKVTEALNLPRSIMATADLSAPLRQGIFAAARNPKMFAKNFGQMFKYALDENAYRNLKADIITSPNYNLYVKHKLPLTDIDQTLTGREEQFLSSWAEKIPGFGKIAKGSNRAYSGFLNKMRMDLFDDFVKTAKLEGITDPKFFDDASKFVGSATGRGKLPDLVEPHAGLLNGVFFSPRLMASRANLINPIYYTKLHPKVRKEALKTLASFVGTGMSILGLAKLNGAEVGIDPRSADFGKIKVGNTRFDIWGGFQQYAVLMSRLLSGEMVSSTTGKETSLTAGGFNPTTRGTIVANFLQSKENPLASFSTKVLTGKNGLDDVNIPAEVVDMFIPMLAQDAYDLSKEYGIGGLAIAIPGAFGVGSQTYQDQIPMFTETATGNVGLKYRQQPSLGEAIFNSVTGTELSNVPKEYWKDLASERLNEQKRQIELTKAKSLVLASGEPQQVGDTYVYLDNGVVKTRKQSKEKRLPLKDQLLYEELKKKKSKPYFTP